MGGGNEALLPGPLADDLGLAVGDQLTLLGDGGPVRVSGRGLLAGRGPDPAAGAGRSSSRWRPAPASSASAVSSRVDVQLGPEATVDGVAAEFDQRLTTEPYVLSDRADLAASLRASTAGFQALTALIAAVTLFVGAFLIFNTLSMTVSERVREVGLLRAAGTTRGQIHRLVLRPGPDPRAAPARPWACCSASACRSSSPGPSARCGDRRYRSTARPCRRSGSSSPAVVGLARDARRGPRAGRPGRPDLADRGPSPGRSEPPIAGRPAALARPVVLTVGRRRAGPWPIALGLAGRADRRVGRGHPRRSLVYAVLLVATLLTPFVLGRSAALAGLPVRRPAATEERLSRRLPRPRPRSGPR